MILKTVITDLSYRDQLIGTRFPEIFEKANQYYIQKTGYVLTSFGRAKTPVFTSSGMVAGNNSVDNTMVNRVEGFIGDILAPYQHWIIPSNINPGCITVVIQANNIQRTIEIDPGYLIGHYEAILPVNGQNVYTRNKNIIKNYI